ncbi:hypothetical protein EJB05_44067, partial [Eragrostis curvula]
MSLGPAAPPENPILGFGRFGDSPMCPIRVRSPADLFPNSQGVMASVWIRTAQHHSLLSQVLILMIKGDLPSVQDYEQVMPHGSFWDNDAFSRPLLKCSTRYNMDAAAPQSWPDLPPDLVHLISGRLHDLADFVRFHAVCKPWRDMLPESQPRPLFLPWLLAPGHRPTDVAQFRSAGTTWCAPGTSSRRNMWLASADGTGRWLLTVCGGGRDEKKPPPPRLINPFTGATATLPRLPEQRSSNLGSRGAATASSTPTAPSPCSTL